MTVKKYNEIINIIFYGKLEEIEKVIKDNKKELQAINYELKASNWDMINLFSNKYPFYDIDKLFN